MARAARDGLIFTGDPGAESLYRHDGDTSNEWDLVTLERLRMAGMWARSIPTIRVVRTNTFPRPYWSSFEGRPAHAMMWHSGAALLSILGVVYPTRSVEEIARLILERDSGWTHQFRTNLGQLDQYADCGCELVVTDPFRDSPELWESLEQDRAALWQRILELSGYDLNGEPSPARGGS